MRRIRVVATRAESALAADRTDRKLDQRAGASTVMTDAEISIPAAKDCLLVRGSACRALAMDSCLQVVRVRRGLRVDGGVARGRQLRGGVPRCQRRCRLVFEVAVAGCTSSNMEATLIGGRAVVAVPLGSARPTGRESLAESFTLGAVSGTRAPDGLVLSSASTWEPL